MIGRYISYVLARYFKMVCYSGLLANRKHTLNLLLIQGNGPAFVGILVEW